jgi:hypothetical protein
MLALWSRCSTPVLLAAVVAGLLGLGAVTLSLLGVDFSELAALKRLADDSERMAVELDGHRDVFLARIRLKERAVDEFVAGRLTLPQAAARFRDVEEALPATRGPARCAATGPAEGERWCREVIDWTLGHHGLNRPGLAARLEADLRRHRGPDGSIRLPD